jgi:NADH-quinone oxidoreductase subunit I
MEQFKDRNIKDGYKFMEMEAIPVKPWDKFKQVVSRTFKGELFVGLWVVFREMLKFNIHTTQYPLEKLPISPRYRAIHALQRHMDSGENRCIGCGLCEKICPANCIKIDTKIDENSRKEVGQYTINFGRCIFCGYCAEVCPELAIVHTGEFENASPQRSHYGDVDSLLTPMDMFKMGQQKEFMGFGAITDNADSNIKKTPTAY